RTVSAVRSHHAGQRCEASASAKNDVLNHGMFMMKIPRSAKPRTMSIVTIRSDADIGRAGESMGFSVFWFVINLRPRHLPGARHEYAPPKSHDTQEIAPAWHVT